MMQSYDELIPLMESITARVAELYDITDQHQAELLLLKYNWNIEQLNEAAIDNPDIIAPYRLLPFNAHSHASVPLPYHYPHNNALLPPRVYCKICGDSDVPGLYGQCGHVFCIDCYKGHIKAAIDGGPTCVTTPCLEYKCATVIPRNVIKSVLDPDYIKKYNKHVVSNFIVNYGKKGRDGIRLYFCVNPECNKVAVVNDMDMDAITTIHCPCGIDICAKCGKESHYPCTCTHVVEWDKKGQSEGASWVWISVYTKQCPKCKVVIEKNQGCNHMTCKYCKHEFCWLCFINWKDYGNSHKCKLSVSDNDAGDGDGDGDGDGAPAPAQVITSTPAAPAPAQVITSTPQTKEKEDRVRYVAYYSRYIDHDKSLKYAKLLPIYTSATELYMNNARQTIIKSRQICKYMFVFIYYNKDQVDSLFEDYVAVLEQLTDNLQELLENKHRFITAAQSNACLYDYNKDMETEFEIINATKLLQPRLAEYNKDKLDSALRLDTRTTYVDLNDEYDDEYEYEYDEYD